MKIGYQYALKTLFNTYREMKKNGSDDMQIKSLIEGIEYLCLPFREDISSSITSKMHNPFADPKETTNVSQMFDGLDITEKNEITKNYFLLNLEANQVLKKIEENQK